MPALFQVKIPVTKDGYPVYVDGACANKEVLKKGLAGHFMRFYRGKEWSELEKSTIEKKGGI